MHQDMFVATYCPTLLNAGAVHRLQSDATYLIVTDDGNIENFGLNAVCTHLGCVVPWNDVSVVCHSINYDDHENQTLQHILKVQSKRRMSHQTLYAWPCVRVVLEGLCCPIGFVAAVAWTILQAM